ncbi:MAG TPA: aldo/keto reductase [Candidatus Dojkabacteria bacterium]|nr:aldo/keto reductase [Candidatus Dojkabacteria bacterium]
MKNIKTLSNKELSPIGIGTYGIGGRGHRDVDLQDTKEDSVYIDALINQFNIGYNFSEISLGYGHGNAAKFFAQALKKSGIDRKDLFLTNSVYPRDILDFKVLEEDIESMYSLFEADYFDSTLVTQSLVVKFGYDQVVKKLWELLNTNRTRYVSLSNSNKKLIKQFSEEFKDKLFAHETHISFEIRECQDEGIFDLCNELNIQTIIWRPLRQGRTIEHNWEPLVRLSKKYGKTQNQIVLNWVKSLGFKPEVFSTSMEHIKENWEAMEFEMEKEDIDELTKYRIPNYIPPKINWENMGNGDSIVPLVMGFEENFNG